MRYQQDFAHVFQKALHLSFITKFNLNLWMSWLQTCPFPWFICRSRLEFRYCVIHLAHLQEITTAFIICKNGCVHVLHWLHLHAPEFFFDCVSSRVWSSSCWFGCVLHSRDASRCIFYPFRSQAVHKCVDACDHLCALRADYYLRAFSVGCITLVHTCIP